MDQDPIPHHCSHCPTAELARFSAGALSPRRQKRVQQHLETCPECRQVLREIAGIQALLRQAPTPLSPRPITLTRQDLRRGRRTLWYPLLRSVTAAAAAIVLVVLLTGLLEPAILDGALAKHPAMALNPTPLPVAVDPASTCRPRPTLNAGPRATAAPTVAPAKVGPRSEYPPPTAAGPNVQGTVTHPTSSAQGSSPNPWWTILHLGALGLLGLLAGLTWLAYRRERAFFG